MAVATVELTERQLEVARLLGKGHTFDEVAKMLGITPRTVKSISDVVRRKLGVDKSRHIGLELRKLGLL